MIAKKQHQEKEVSTDLISCNTEYSNEQWYNCDIHLVHIKNSNSSSNSSSNDGVERTIIHSKYAITLLRASTAR